jgi:hypothetical protein
LFLLEKYDFGRPLETPYFDWGDDQHAGAIRRMRRPHNLSATDAEIDRSKRPLDTLRWQQRFCPHNQQVDELAWCPAKMLVRCPECHGVLRKTDRMHTRVLS